MNNIGVIGGADGETVIMVSGSIAPPILWSFFGALALMAILYFCFYRRAKGKAVCLALAAVLCVAAELAVRRCCGSRACTTTARRGRAFPVRGGCSSF